MSFGEESGQEQGKQNFKYNGKELDKEYGLNQYDYAPRFMDPSMIRFTTVDPLGEKYFSWSPYVYVANNPMKFIDPDGKQTGFPPGFVCLPENIKTSAIQQKVEPMVIDAAKPAAVSTNMSVAHIGQNGLGVSGSYTQSYLLKGQDAGTLNTYVKGGGVTGTPGTSAGIGFELSFYGDKDSFLFNAQSLEGESIDMDASIIGKAFGITLTRSYAETEDGVPIISYGIQFEVGGSGFSTGKSKSTQMQGAQSSDKKTEERGQYEEQQEQKQKEIGNSLWNWLTK